MIHDIKDLDLFALVIANLFFLYFTISWIPARNRDNLAFLGSILYNIVLGLGLLVRLGVFK